WIININKFLFTDNFCNHIMNRENVLPLLFYVKYKINAVQFLQKNLYGFTQHIIFYIPNIARFLVHIQFMQKPYGNQIAVFLLFFRRLYSDLFNIPKRI